MATTSTISYRGRRHTHTLQKRKWRLGKVQLNKEEPWTMCTNRTFVVPIPKAYILKPLCFELLALSLSPQDNQVALLMATY